MLHPWSEQRCLALYCTECMEAGGGSEIMLKGFRRWRWCHGGRLPGQTAPGGQRWLPRGWVPRTWGPQWSCRLPGRLPVPPPDEPDALRGRDTYVHWVLHPESWKAGGSRRQKQQQMRRKRLRPEEDGSVHCHECFHNLKLSASYRTLLRGRTLTERSLLLTFSRGQPTGCCLFVWCCVLTGWRRRSWKTGPHWWDGSGALLEGSVYSKQPSVERMWCLFSR